MVITMPVKIPMIYLKLIFMCENICVSTSFKTMHVAKQHLLHDLVDGGDAMVMTTMFN